MEVEFIQEGHIYLVDGIITPSVSEIIRFIYPDKYSGIPQKVLEEKALFGTHIHHAIEDLEKGREVFLTDLEKVVFQQYLRLKEKHYIKSISQEEIVHYGYRYAGTLDSISMIDGQECIVDYKTTSRVDYESLSWQLGMYQLAKGKKYDKCYCIWLPKKELGKLIEIIPRTKDEIIGVLENYEKQKI